MKNEKWLLGEINKWQGEDIISGQTADVLRQRYSSSGDNSPITVFAIIGALLIGAGVILIGAKNWYEFPLSIRAIISFLPLLAAQALAVYVLKKRYYSTPWREAVALGVSAGVFAAVALVGQTFHLAGDYGTYLLVCGLLFLPVIYILNAASPLLLYYYTIINWAALDGEAVLAPALGALFLAGLLYVFISRKNMGSKFQYMVWISAIAGVAVFWVLGFMLEGSILLALMLYFTLLFSLGGVSRGIEPITKAISILGAWIIMMILTYQFAWGYADAVGTVWYLVFAGAVLISSLYFGIRSYKGDLLKMLFFTALIVMCSMRLVWNHLELDLWPWDFGFMIASNAVAGLSGVGFIVRGVQKGDLFTMNVGLAAVCLLIVLRFFDVEMDFLWRGIVFLALGVGFLMVNLRILKFKKRDKEAV